MSKFKCWVFLQPAAKQLYSLAHIKPKPDEMFYIEFCSLCVLFWIFIPEYCISAKLIEEKKSCHICMHMYIYIKSSTEIPMKTNKSTKKLCLETHIKKHEKCLQLWWRQNGYFSISEKIKWSMKKWLCKLNFKFAIKYAISISCENNCK